MKPGEFALRSAQWSYRQRWHQAQRSRIRSIAFSPIESTAVHDCPLASPGRSAAARNGFARRLEPMEKNCSIHTSVKIRMARLDSMRTIGATRLHCKSPVTSRREAVRNFGSIIEAVWIPPRANCRCGETHAPHRPIRNVGAIGSTASRNSTGRTFQPRKPIPTTPPSVRSSPPSFEPKLVPAIRPASSAGQPAASANCPAAKVILQRPSASLQSHCRSNPSRSDSEQTANCLLDRGPMPARKAGY